MNLTFRRVIYTSFFVVFFIAAFGLLFYQQGYRYNPAKGKIEQTGALNIESIPSGSTVIINGIVQTNKTPNAWRSLTPDVYDVIVTHPGFQPWHKLLNVKTSHVTASGIIRLWPQPSAGRSIFLSNPEFTLLAPNHGLVLYYTKSGLKAGLWIYNLHTTETNRLTNQPVGTITRAEWSPSSRKILFQLVKTSGQAYSIYNLENGSWNAVAIPTDAQIVHWGETDSVLIAATKTAIHTIKPREGSDTILWRDSLTDFVVNKGLIIGLSKNSPILQLKIFDTKEKILLTPDKPIANSSNFTFLEAKPGVVLVYNNDHRTLYLIRTDDSAPTIEILPEAEQIDWSEDGNTLLLTNNFEIWQYNLNKKLLSLIMRLSTPLVKSRFYKLEPYILYASGKQIWAIELDTRAEQQRWLLAEYQNNVQDVIVDPSGRAFNVITEQGLYQVPITQADIFGLRTLKP